MLIRSPIVCVMGHVDHGKTTILDSVRGSRVAQKEAGGITQMIGASYIRRQDIDALADSLKGRMKFDLKIPGLLFIDTPGHEAFTNLRDRGGSIADIAILVIDINQGFQPQTLESLRILKQYKTPFVVAANKIDVLSGWNKQSTTSFLESMSKQPSYMAERLDEKIYQLMGKLSEHGFDCERFDRISDFKSQIAIIPVSAKTKEGMSELLMLIAGLSQKFLEGKLEMDEKGAGKGSIIEIKDEKGLGTTIDVILYDGVLRKGDEVIFLSENGPKKTKIRGLLEPNISGGKEKYAQVDIIPAAAGVKILAPDLDGAIPGSPIEACIDFEKGKQKLEKLMKNIIFEKTDKGVIVRSDSLGSLEALIKLLTEKKIPIKEAAIGNISKKDVLDAKVVSKSDKFLGAVLGFNVYAMDDAVSASKNEGIPLIISDIIYKVVEHYSEWVASQKEEEKKSAWKNLTWPAEIKALPGFCFRVSKPAIFGIKVLEGIIKPGYKLMDASGNVIGEIREIQHEKDKIEKATRGMEVAVSCDGILYGKDVNENDLLYTHIPKHEFDEWKKHANVLSSEDKELLDKISKILFKTPW